MLSWDEITGRALKFSKQWKNAKDESAEAQSFLNDFFYIFGIDRRRVATFETKVPMGRKNGYIDLLWKGIILIEMKSKGKNLDKAHSQAKDYAFNLEDEELPEYTMVCDFENIRLYRNTTNQIWNFKTSQLHKHVKRFSDMAGYKATIEIAIDKDVDVKAAEKMAKLHDILKSHGYQGHNLEVYLVRLLFCIFADDTGIFEKNLFFDYVSNSKKDGSDLSYRVGKLFDILNMNDTERIKQTMLTDEHKRFRYINGGLFAEGLPLADFDYKMRKILMECGTLNWAYISPAIFGSMFQGVMDPIEQRELGAHYTSEENILKVIKPLFLNELREEFERIKGDSIQLQFFHEKIAKLKFLDPACGCGNFLIITYRELRLLELDVLKMLFDYAGQMVLDIAPYQKIKVTQFYGIEYEEFPSQIAQVGMWLVDHQMNILVSEYFGQYYMRLPLEAPATIIYGNALRENWENIVPKNELNYILGNPPFVGFTYMNNEQNYDMTLFTKSKSLDYVCAWYLKSAEYIENTRIKVAFVSTNSIVQGEPVSFLWDILINEYNISIDFAYRTFVWKNEASGNAAVHCIIIGFSENNDTIIKHIYDQEKVIIAQNINPYLIDAPNILVKSRNKPLCDIPEMHYGNKIVDGGNLIIEENEYNDFILKEPQAKVYIKKFVGSKEFINNQKRYILNLQNANPSELRKCPLIMERVNAVKDFRLNSRAPSTRAKAETPTLFGQITNSKNDYLLIPCVSSERRTYVPIGFVDKDTVASNAVQIIPDATLYHFGVLTSIVHMTWMKAVCGRLKSDYRYGKDVVYNNFPWPDPSEQQKEIIEKAAETVIVVRNLYPNSSLADLYDPLAMPNDLLRAHRTLDRAVANAYGTKCNSEAERLTDLMERYKKLTF